VGLKEVKEPRIGKPLLCETPFVSSLRAEVPFTIPSVTDRDEEGGWDEFKCLHEEHAKVRVGDFLMKLNCEEYISFHRTMRVFLRKNKSIHYMFWQVRKFLESCSACHGRIGEAILY